MASGSHARAEPPVSDRVAFRGGLLVSNAVTPSWDGGPEAGILVGLEWSHFGDVLYGGLDASLGGVPFRGSGPFLGGHVGWHATRGERFRFLAAAAGGGLHSIRADCFDCDDSFQFPFIGVRGEISIEGRALAIGFFFEDAQDLGRERFDYPPPSPPARHPVARFRAFRALLADCR